MLSLDYTVAIRNIDISKRGDRDICFVTTNQSPKSKPERTLSGKEPWKKRGWKEDDWLVEPEMR